MSCSDFSPEESPRWRAADDGGHASTKLDKAAKTTYGRIQSKIETEGW